MAQLLMKTEIILLQPQNLETKFWFFREAIMKK